MNLPDHLIPCLEGAFDLHVHSAPDIMPRKTDDFELARQAKTARLGGFVLKSHHVPTADRATLVRQIVPGVEIFGAIVLNNFVGGLNPQAVEVQARLGAKMVWLPTLDARNEAGKLEHSDPAQLPYWATIQRELLMQGYLRPPIDVLTDDGRPCADLLAVLELVRDHKLILATGHLSPTEIHHVVVTAHDLGLARIVITHPDMPSIAMSAAQQAELVPYGVYFEHCWGTAQTGRVSWATVFDMVRRTGPAHNILSTDLGQPHGLFPVEGLAAMIQRYADEGFSPTDIRQMTVVNPGTLLH